MVDITMCVNSQCPIREFCYRYRAKPSERQSYSVFGAIHLGSDAWRCYEFWDLREEKRLVVSLEEADSRNKITERQIKELKNG